MKDLEKIVVEANLDVEEIKIKLIKLRLSLLDPSQIKSEAEIAEQIEEATRLATSLEMDAMIKEIEQLKIYAHSLHERKMSDAEPDLTQISRYLRDVSRTLSSL